MVPVNVLLRLVKMGIEKKLIRMDSLMGAFAGEKWENPYAQQVDTAATVHLRVAVDKVASRFSSENKAQFKKQLQVLAGVAQENEDKISVAASATRHFFSPNVVLKLPDECIGRGTAKFGMGLFEGRTVFTGQFAYKDQGLGDWMLDAFRTDHPDKRLVNLSMGGNPFVYGTPPQIFEWKGHTYSAHFHEGTAYDLATGESVMGKRLRALRKPRILFSSYDMSNQGTLIIPYNEKLMVVSAWNDGSTPGPRSFLGVVDLNGPGSRYQGISDGSVARSPPGFNMVDGHPIVGWIPRGQNGVQFIDLSGAVKKFPPIKVVVLDFQNANSIPAAYSVDGEWRAIFPYIDLQNGPGVSLGIGNIRKGKFLRNIALPLFAAEGQGQIHLTQMHGQPFAYLKVEDEIVVVNLRTETVSTFPAKEMSSEISEFDFEGAKYLIWGTFKGGLEIYDLTNNTHIARTPIGDREIHQILTFDHDGEPLAFVASRERTPVLVRLLGEVEPGK